MSEFEGISVTMKKQSESGKCEEMEKLCRICNRPYLPSSNSSSSCRFHPSFFVCRRHDDQKRVSSQLLTEFSFALQKPHRSSRLQLA
ncbi:uncharacterized protein E6C27_scaffold223G00780 [Cucumis melo var. makuwa]|uniref:Uncharacterized protein n=1 Tax=Cucumis melo var. makuwa TaxID=1194695 RepID=A0A5A7SN82_CUCMM|nr:uncharacterized protein E6C27_scaffold223G00780 [Cucumis melo var. makuwa]